MSEEPIIATKDQVGDYDAIETLKPGEPVFPLQGGDPYAPACIELWVDQCRKAARDEQNVEKRKALLHKALSAERVLWACLAYQRGEEIANVDRTIINEVQDDTRLWRAPLIRATQHLREAAFEFANSSEHLPVEMALPLKARIDLINRVADEYEPRRASYGQQPELPLA